MNLLMKLWRKKKESEIAIFKKHDRINQLSYTQKKLSPSLFLGIFIIFTYTLCSEFLLFTLHYVTMKVLFDLKEGMVWILTWLINVCGVIFLVFDILSWDYECLLSCFTVLHLIYMWDISLCSTLFCSHMFECYTIFEVILFVKC